MQEQNYKKTSPVTILLAWTVVSIPLAYGIYYTVVKAASLFH